jgi:hypothetical protein
MQTRKFPVTIRFRATDKERKRLKRLAAHFQRSEASVLRLLVTEAWRRLPKADVVAPK